MKMIKCPKCGTENPDGSNFCQGCAFRLSDIVTRVSIQTQDISADSNNELKYFVKGTNGQLYVYGDRIEIKRKGFLALAQQGLKGTKSIPFSSIKSIQIKPAGFAIGYIQFGISGGFENSRGLKQANYDENTVTFTSAKYNKIANEIKAYIENAILKITAQPVQQNLVVEPHKSDADELRKFAELLNDGIITQEEYNIKKKQLLGL